jgi:transposase-like protein
MSKRRAFTREKKLEILRYAEDHGMVATCREYELSQSLFYRWKHAFENKGMDGLEPSYYRVDPEVRELEKENERLRKIIAKQALEIEVKSELLKKNDQIQRRKRWSS